MKKIFLSLIAIMATMSINAQVVKVYDTKTSTTEPVATYTNSSNATYEVVFVKAPAADEYVDLGLSVKWATCNVGAENCYDYGDYFAWGETTGYDEGKTTFLWSTYTLCQGSSLTMTRYCTNSSYGTVDNKTVLEASDDAATANWGRAWRMPTYDELSELSNTSNCSWTWYAAGNTEFNGVAGYKVQSLKAGYTDKYIFLPAAGFRADHGSIYDGICGYYWSSSLSKSESYDAMNINFYDSSNGKNSHFRCDGHSVRPVTE